MDAETRLNAAIEVLERLEIVVQREHLGGTGGGLCVVRGTRRVFLDLDTDVATQLEVVAAALRTVRELESVYIPPVLRELIDQRDP